MGNKWSHTAQYTEVMIIESPTENRILFPNRVAIVVGLNCFALLVLTIVIELGKRTAKSGEVFNVCQHTRFFISGLVIFKQYATRILLYRIGPHKPIKKYSVACFLFLQVHNISLLYLKITVNPILIEKISTYFAYLLASSSNFGSNDCVSPHWSISTLSPGERKHTGA